MPRGKENIQEPRLEKSRVLKPKITSLNDLGEIICPSDGPFRFGFRFQHAVNYLEAEVSKLDKKRLSYPSEIILDLAKDVYKEAKFEFSPGLSINNTKGDIQEYIRLFGFYSKKYIENTLDIKLDIKL